MDAMSPHDLFSPAPCYEADLHAWAFDQARRLRGLEIAGLDVRNLAEEIEGLARRARREVDCRLTALITNLLRWSVQPECRGEAQAHDIGNERGEIAMILGDSPSLWSVLPRIMEQAYCMAVKSLVAEATMLAEGPLSVCAWKIDRILCSDWFPE